jgi:hypothetical protein
MQSPLSLRKTVPPLVPGGHGEWAQCPVSSTVLPCGQMHAPMSISPSMQGGGGLHVPSEARACPVGQICVTQRPCASRTSFSPHVGGAGVVGAGAADADATAEGAAAEADGAGGASAVTGGATGADAHASGRRTTADAASAITDVTRRRNTGDLFRVPR